MCQVPVLRLLLRRGAYMEDHLPGIVARASRKTETYHVVAVLLRHVYIHHSGWDDR